MTIPVGTKMTVTCHAHILKVVKHSESNGHNFSRLIQASVSFEVLAMNIVLAFYALVIISLLLPYV